MNSKTIIGIVVVVIAVIIILGIASSVTNKTSSPTTTSVISSSTTPSTTSSTQTSTTSAVTTTSITNSKYLVKIINVTDAQAVAEEDGHMSKTYIVVYLNITYLGSSSFTPNIADFSLYTNEGIYSACDFEPPGISGYLDTSVTLTHGNFIVGGVAFLVPSSAIPERLTYTNLFGQTYFNISLPKPNSFISFITDVTCKSTDSSVIVTASSNSTPFNIQGFNGQSFTITLEISNEHFSTPVTIQGITLSPAFSFKASENYKGLVINPGNTVYITLTIYFPNESYYGNLNINVDVT